MAMIQQECPYCGFQCFTEVKPVVLLYIFLWKPIFFQHSFMNRKLKKQHLLEILQQMYLLSISYKLINT